MARRRGVLATLAQMQREADREKQRRARVAARSRQEANRAAAARNRAAVQDQKQRDRLYAESRAQDAAEDTAELEHQVEALQNLLSATLQVDDYLDLEALKRPPQYPAFDPGVVGAPPLPPSESAYAVAGPSGLGRVFGGSKHAAQVEQRQAEYRRAVDAYQVAAQQHARLLDDARRLHDADIARQAGIHQQHVDEITALQRDLAARKPEAVVRYLDLVLATADYPEDFPHTWRLAYTSASGNLAIDYELPRIAIVPSIKAYKYVKSSDTVTETARPATQVRSIYAEVLRQTALRIVHEVFEADRGHVVRTVVLNGYVSAIDPATGRPARRCLLALATSREKFLDLNLAQVNTADCLVHLEARISKDPGKLLAVEPIELAGSLQADFTVDADDDGASEDTSPLSDPSPTDGLAPPSRTTEPRELSAGQNVPIDEPDLQVELPAGDADLSLLLVGSDGRVDRDEDFVFFNNPLSTDGAVRLTGNRASIDTALLPNRCARVVLVVSAGDSSTLNDATAVLRLQHSGSEFRFRPVDSDRVSALVWGELYLRNDNWRLRAVGQGWSDGLAGVARDYGVDVD